MWKSYYFGRCSGREYELSCLWDFGNVASWPGELFSVVSLFFSRVSLKCLSRRIPCAWESVGALS